MKKTLAIPFTIGVMIWLLNLLTDPASPEVIQQGGELIAQAAIPWWIPVLKFLANLSPLLAAIFLVLLFRDKNSH